VRGLTNLDKKLFVVYQNSGKIYVYDTQQQYTQLPNISVNELKDPQDIAACRINRCLYVADAGKDVCVWKVNLDQTVDKWLKRDKIVKVDSLSVTSEGHIVMLVKNEPRSRVDIYNSNGVTERIVCLPSDVGHLNHVVQTDDKSLIFSRGLDDTERHEVYKVNSKEVIVDSYGGSHDSNLKQLSWPRYITLDREERVFVADYGNRRVLLLDKQLNLLCVLQTWSSECCCPWRLFYDCVTTQLMVGFKSGQVEIFSLS
jgi:uncharacterized protein YaeQ